MDEREKQQEPVAWVLTCEGRDVQWTRDAEIVKKWEEKLWEGEEIMSLYTTPPTAALAASQMRDAAVKVCRDAVERAEGGYVEAYKFLGNVIAALPILGEEK